MKRTLTQPFPSIIRFDLIVADQITFPLPLLKRFCSPKILFYCHFPDKLLVQQQQQRGFLHRSLYRRVFDWAEEVCLARGADRVVVNSKFTQVAFMNAFPSLKVPTVLYPGVRIPSKSNGEITTARKEKTFLSLNRFERKKDIELALEALALMRNQAKLIVAGGFDTGNRENVEYLAELEQLCERLNLSHSRSTSDALKRPERVVFAPSIQESLKESLLNTCHPALLYTPQNEHFGIVPVEAMSRGSLVLAMDSGGLKETVVPGRTGWLCRNRDAKEMAALMDRAMELNSQKWQEMSRFAAEQVREKFSLEAFSRNLNSLVQEMIK